MWTKGILFAVVSGLLLFAVDDASACHRRRHRRGCGSQGGCYTTYNGAYGGKTYAPAAGGEVAPAPPAPDAPAPQTLP
jgi:hypothetical protein